MKRRTNDKDVEIVTYEEGERSLKSVDSESKETLSDKVERQLKEHGAID